MCEGYQDARREFSLVDDAAAVEDRIALFRQLVDRNVFTGDERNIDYWRRQGWQQFKSAVDDQVGVVTRTQRKTGRRKATTRWWLTTQSG